MTDYNFDTFVSRSQLAVGLGTNEEQFPWVLMEAFSMIDLEEVKYHAYNISGDKEEKKEFLNKLREFVSIMETEINGPA